jgi:O-6-methylguanine DNA methyltransferase
MTDRLDDLLREHFRPDASPPTLAPAVLRAAAAGAAGIRRLRIGGGGTAVASAPRGLVARARAELAEYLEGRRTYFSVPVDLSDAGEFQRRVLAAARDIPFGETRPYAWLARRIDAAGAVRAVGTALGRNPAPILIPCHRVVRRDGGMGGYAFGVQLKRRLLTLERTTPVLAASARTRIVCRVGCPDGRRTHPESRIVFASVADARSLGYRPCRRCRPEQGASA